MKKLFISLACLAMSQAMFAQEGALKISGKISGMSNKILVLYVKDGARAIDTVAVNNGEFAHSITLAKPMNIRLAMLDNEKKMTNKGLSLVGVPGEAVVVSGDVASEITFDGTKFYKELAVADKLISNAQKPLEELSSSLTARLRAGEKQDDLMKEYQEKAGPMMENIKNTIKNYIEQNPASEVSAALIPQLEDVETMEVAVAKLDATVREGRMKDFFMQTINQIKQQREAEERAAKLQAPGVEIPEFVLDDINGNRFMFSSLRGKYVVLDFWGAWCGWCIKGMPEMKKYYEKYSGKFEILGIDCNDTEQKWKDAVAKHELPWLHVYNPRSSSLLRDLGITGFPTKIIVGPDGKIVKTIVGESPEFYTTLDELLGK